MKNQVRNKSGLMKKNMNITDHVAEAFKNMKKKANWKSKTSKWTKTLIGKTLNSKKIGMTEDDIDKLFKQHSKEKQSAQVHTKVSTEVDDCCGIVQYRDFVNAIKFLKVGDSFDRFLSGLPAFPSLDDSFSFQIQDLTSQFKQSYLVGKVIGEGAYATVRIAVHKAKQLKVALKIYQKSKIKQIQRKKSVIRQIKILQLLSHPNIVKIYDVVETNNHLNIVMQFLSGHSLGTYLKAQPNGKIPQKTCKKIFHQIAKALAYMHKLNVSHRDIKLQNIILDEDLCPKLIDFGFSTCIEAADKVKIFCGTPSYMAPEVVQRKQYRGEAADVWAFGVLLFVSLTGIFPFRGATDQQLFKKIGDSDYPKNELSSSTSKTVRDLISKMLKINSQQRITASDIINHIWFSQGRNELSSKKNAESSSHDARKRVYTIYQKHPFEFPQKLKTRNQSNKAAQKSGKKILAETCKQNLGLQLKLVLKSPKHKQIVSFRKKTDNKQNIKQSIKNEKNLNSTLLKHTLLKQSFKDNDLFKKKDKFIKTQPKAIELLKPEVKKKHQKSKSNTHRT